MNYARFFYPTLFPDAHGRIVHVDDDCIVQGITMQFNYLLSLSLHLVGGAAILSYLFYVSEAACKYIFGTNLSFLYFEQREF